MARMSYSVSGDSHDGARRNFRPCKSQENLKDGKGQFAIEVVFGNPEPAPAILRRGKDIGWCRRTRMDDYYRPVLRSYVRDGREGQIPRNIVRWDIDLETELGQHA